jgi:hypothetical protein
MRTFTGHDEAAIPDANTDFPAANSTDKANDANAHPERVLAVLEMLRHGSITLEKGAALVGLSKQKIIHLLNKLHIPFEQ